MTFIRTKTHQNKRRPPRMYLFLVKNYRPAPGKVPKQVTVRFLGRYRDEPLETLQNRLPGLANELEAWFQSRTKRIAKRLQEAELSLRRSREYLEDEDND